MAERIAIDVSQSLSFGRGRRGNPLRRTLRFVRRQPLGALGVIIICVIVYAAIAAPVIAPHHAGNTNFDILKRPSPGHPFGTDRVGRDILSRVIYGARTSMTVGFASVAFGVVAGTLLGLVCGYLVGWVDAVVQRFADVILAFPYLILALFVGAAVGPGVLTLVSVLGVAMAPGVLRIVRGSVFVEREKEYVLAARAMGSPAWQIMLRQILPNVLAPIIIIGTTLLAAAILAEAALSFLGLGVPPATPSWGGDLSGSARDYFEAAPWMAIFPGAALSLAVLGFNFFGDALRDLLDPRLRGAGGG